LPGMRVLVTGAAGFVGGHLLPRLEAAGWSVTASDREMDVSDPAAVEARVRDVEPDAIIHLAAVSSVATSWQQPELTYRVNYLGTRTVLEVAQRTVPTARVILVSTADLYGSTEPGAPPFDEFSELQPRSPYARCKAAADLLGGVYTERGLDVVRVRPFNHTGPGQTDTFVLPSFARQVASIEAGRSEPSMRVGNLDSIRDFLDIDDVTDAYIRLLDPMVASGTYNVASGAGVRVGDALRTLCSLAGIEPRIEVASEFFRPTDFAVGDSTRLRAATGWQPRVPFDRTLERLLDHWRGRVTAA
jgi:GDP-4-dehydro-6-deoxy-D-mannose reductase